MNITADALHTQRSFADYLVRQRDAHYFFIVKKNQPTLRSDIEFHFQSANTEADCVDVSEGEHGRIETRSIWTTNELNEYLDFSHVGQAFMLKREFVVKKTSKVSHEKVYGITNRTAEEVSPEKILNVVRGHWTIENGCHYILDWNFDEDRCRISKGHGPENVARLRRFAIGLIKSKTVYSVSHKMRKFNKKTRAVLDCLKMTKNSQAAHV